MTSKREFQVLVDRLEVLCAVSMSLDEVEETDLVYVGCGWWMLASCVTHCLKA